jgi:hypothetical protein
MRLKLALLVALIISAPVLVAVMVTVARGEPGEQDAAYRAFYRSFADITCCWSNRCCDVIDEDAVQHLSGHRYLIKATGEHVTAKGYSPDGRFHRCACNKNMPGWQEWWGDNKTRCFFIPNTGV